MPEALPQPAEDDDRSLSWLDAVTPEEQSALEDAAAELQRQNDALRYSQRAAEAALERFATLFSSVPLALFVIDEEGLVLQSNAKALDWFRANESDPPIHFLLPLVAPIHQARVAEAIAQAAGGGSCQAMDVTLVRSAGPLHCDLHLARLDHAAAWGEDDRLQFVCAVVDQTSRLEQKAAQERQLALESQLRESQKMQAIGTLAGGIAHDFNNILAAILGNSELALQDLPPGEQAAAARQSLAEIEKAGRRARDLVHQILTFSRKEPLKLTPVALADVLLETQSLIRLALPPHITLSADVPPDLPPALADATQASQALLNLCTNAIQAMGVQVGSLHVALSWAPPDSHLTLSVRDTGPGIPAENIDRVFEPFFTTKPVGEGTGLGLAVVHGIMGAHGGSVTVRSTPGQGCQFDLRFQVAGRHGAGSVAPARSVELLHANTLSGHGEHILVVDDDSALLFLLDRALRRQGYTATTCSSGHAALDLLQFDTTPFDLLLSDYNMPGMSGLDLLAQARSLRPGLRVALSSGYVTAELEREALAAGAVALIHKPSGAGEIVEVVRRVLNPA
jgi:two-component system, cell cycle sensor histidine kinase and response regulator CckA